ncbi:hypothetical protein Patl1_35549 [Pistacia atlantica]|nr:hypothetical protein Patl1_35549 [Pistacia atlantica]
MNWEEFKQGVHARFCPTKFQDFFDDLIKLKQFGSVKEHQIEFECHLSWIGQVTSQQQVSYFIDRLRDNLQVDVRAGNPITLEATISLARLFKARNQAIQRSSLLDNSKVKQALAPLRTP